MKQDYLKFGNGHAFDPKPMFYDHQCHWAPWADHYQEADGDMGLLANMLGSSLEENKRLLDRLKKFDKAHANLLFSFIALVETGKPVPFVNDESLSIGGAWACISVLNEWRRLNKLNIKVVDVS